MSKPRASTPPKQKKKSPIPKQSNVKTTQDLYEQVAKQQTSDNFLDQRNGDRSRSPYLVGKKMGRGSAFAPDFKYFIESGGIGKWKSCVVMSMRLNEIRDVNSINGSGTFFVNFFLDTAFWVPEWDEKHFETQKTVGEFSLYEPLLEFPEVDVDNGMLRWGSRTAEFSKHVGKSRHHEIQIGQNYESILNIGNKNKNKKEKKYSDHGASTLSIRELLHTSSKITNNVKEEEKNLILQKNKLKSVKKISVIDVKSHWPRLWRVCLNDDEIQQLSSMDKKKRKEFEPTNEHPTRCNERMKQMFEMLDFEREKNLSHPTEGIAFVTYEISCTHRAEFALQEFPFDLHNLKIIVRIAQKDKDPLQRAIIPIAHDKGFFMSSRISELSDFHLAQNFDWSVVKEPSNIGGEKLIASAIIRRKPGHYIRNYIIIIFLLSSSSFSTFLARPDDFESRAIIIFTILLSVVAFKYSGGNEIPKVPYSTIFESYIILNFYIVLTTGIISFLFSMICGMSGTESGNYEEKVQIDLACSSNPGRRYSMEFLPEYNPVFETCCGLCFFGFWLATNAWYWYEKTSIFHSNILAINSASLSWLHFHYKSQKGIFPIEDFVLRKQLSSSFHLENEIEEMKFKTSSFQEEEIDENNQEKDKPKIHLRPSFMSYAGSEASLSTNMTDLGHIKSDNDDDLNDVLDNEPLLEFPLDNISFKEENKLKTCDDDNV